MDVRSEIREFLASRRAQLAPSTVGFPDLGRARRVPGLRREEVAVLAGISAPYYARLERGDLVHASPDVVDAVGRALRLDDSQRAYLTDLTSWHRRRVHDDEPSHASNRRSQVPATLVNLLSAMTGAAAFVVNDREEVLAANPLGRALAAPLFAMGREVNVARFVFLDPGAPDFLTDSWATAASKTSSTLRTALGRSPGDRRLTSLISELSSRSEPFRRVWETRDVALWSSGPRRWRHPVVGRIELDFERLALPHDPRLMLTTFGAPPDSASARSLAALSETPT